MSNSEVRSHFEVVIVGGSLYSLVLAGALVNSGIRPNEILLVEGSNSLGGQFRSDRCENNLLFDKGTRILYETGDRRADDFIARIVERCESSILSGNKRDIGGVYLSRQLETGSVFPSFRNVSVTQQLQILGEILIRAGRNSREVVKSVSSLSEYLDEQFGPTARELIHETISQHIFRVRSAELSLRALEMLPLSRLSGFDHQSMIDFSKSERLRSRLAFPDQLRLPLIRENNYRGFYPITQGIEKYVVTAGALLREAGVQVLLGHSVNKIQNSPRVTGAVELLLLGVSGQSQTVSASDKVLWTSGPRMLSASAGIDGSLVPPDASRKVSITHMLVNNVDRMGELYYAYNYDPSLSLFRVTNYSAYSQGLRDSNFSPITVERFNDESSEADSLEILRRDLGVLLGVNQADGFEIQIVGQSSGFFPQPRLDVEERWNLITGVIADRFQGSLRFPGLESKVAKFLGRDLVIDLLSQCDHSTH